MHYAALLRTAGPPCRGKTPDIRPLSGLKFFAEIVFKSWVDTSLNNSPREKISMSNKLVVVVISVWLLLISLGMWFLWTYQITPGRAANPPRIWPTSSQIVLDAQLPTMVLAIHPRCPCSRATIGELAQLMARTRGRVNAQVLFVRPAGSRPDWEKTDLWNSVASIPGVNLSVDYEGHEALRFGSRTSGQVLLYNPEGRLIFNGGITGSRGHSGDNDGRDAVVSLLTVGAAKRTETPVFGCPLFNEASKNEVEEFCDAHK